MSASSIPLKQLEDITECSICSETFVDTRVLPCIHTYCLRCITSLAGDKKAGDKIPCPLCRKEFAIPQGGISDLPKNYFVEKLLEAKSLASILSDEDSLCDVCAVSEEMLEGGRKRDGKAAVYCVSCHKSMCKQCYGYHQQFKMPGTHKIIECNKIPLPVDDLLLKFPEASCDKHPDKSLEIYCFECKAAICMLCYIKEQHNSHKCTDVKDVANDLAAPLTANAEGIKAKIEDCKSMLEKIADEERFLTDEVKETETVINEKADKLKQLIDQHREEVLTKLITSKNRQLKENENVKHELERQIVVMESFLRYSGELKEKGTPCDIVKNADELCAKGAELVKFDVNVDLPIDYTSTVVKFEATLSDDDIKRVFGDLDITIHMKDYAADSFLNSAKLAQTIPNNGGGVTGIATLGDEMFVVRWSYPHIQVYKHNADDVAIQRNVNVGAGTNTFRSLAACEFNQCLYVSEQNAQIIHKVSPVTNNTVHKWSVGGQPYGVTVNSAHNLLVACYNTHKVQEYTTDGALVREINLQPDITSPAYVVQLRGDEFGITHHGSVHRYCVVGSDGKIVKSTGSGQMSSPHGFAVSKGGKVFVADHSNGRILLLNSFSIEQLPAAFSVSFNTPYCIHFDERAGVMYVGEWNAGRMLCFKK